MIIDNKNGTVSSDAVICITFDDIITTAYCNGESILKAFKGIMEIALADAQAMVKQYENELEQAARKE